MRSSKKTARLYSDGSGARVEDEEFDGFGGVAGSQDAEVEHLLRAEEQRLARHLQADRQHQRPVRMRRVVGSYSGPFRQKKKEKSEKGNNFNTPTELDVTKKKHKKPGNKPNEVNIPEYSVDFIGIRIEKKRSEGKKIRTPLTLGLKFHTKRRKTQGPATPSSVGRTWSDERNRFQASRSTMIVKTRSHSE